MKRMLLRKGEIWCRSVGIVDLCQLPQGLFMGDECDIRSVQKVGGSNVVSMIMTVYYVRDRQVRHRAECLHDFVADRRRSIHDDNALACHKEDWLVYAISDHICALTETLNSEASSVRHRWSDGCWGYWCICWHGCLSGSICSTSYCSTCKSKY